MKAQRGAQALSSPPAKTGLSGVVTALRGPQVASAAISHSRQQIEEAYQGDQPPRSSTSEPSPSRETSSYPQKREMVVEMAPTENPLLRHATTSHSRSTTPTGETVVEVAAAEHPPSLVASRLRAAVSREQKRASPRPSAVEEEEAIPQAGRWAAVVAAAQASES